MTQIEFTQEEARSFHIDPADITKKNSPLSPQKKRKLQSIPWLDGPYDSVRGEKALWIAVITQAMMDALSRARNVEAAYYKHEAIGWLTGNSKDFVEVCLLAGLEPSYVRRKAKRALVSPRPWRAGPGKGKRYLERKAYRDRLKKSMDMPPPPFNGERNCSIVIEGPWKARICA